MVGNLVVEIAIYNFDLFHYTLLHVLVIMYSDGQAPLLATF